MVFFYGAQRSALQKPGSGKHRVPKLIGYKELISPCVLSCTIFDFYTRSIVIKCKYACVPYFLPYFTVREQLKNIAA